jgi:hypothetical protein
LYLSHNLNISSVAFCRPSNQLVDFSTVFLFSKI